MSRMSESAGSMGDREAVPSPVGPDQAMANAARESDAVAVERMFAQEGVRTIMGTAQAAGVVMVAAARRGLPVTMHTP